MEYRMFCIEIFENLRHMPVFLELGLNYFTTEEVLIKIHKP